LCIKLESFLCLFEKKFVQCFFVLRNEVEELSTEKGVQKERKLVSLLRVSGMKMMQKSREKKTREK
jgi:hypothetical protein